jgi:general secretion pathway protein G
MSQEQKNWWYAKGEQRFGPCTVAELRAQAAAGQLSSADLVWQEGLANWLPASSIEGLVAAQQSISNAAQFNVVLEGTTLPGLDIATVRTQLATLLERDIEFAGRLLDGQATTIKSAVDAATGQRYVDALLRAGATASLHPETLELDANLDVVDYAPSGHAPKIPNSPIAAQASTTVSKSIADEPAPEDYYGAFIGPKNQDFYLRYFARRDAGGSVLSWHWPAFFVTWSWLLTRKMWGLSWLYLALSLIPLLAAAVAGTTPSAETLAVQFLWIGFAWVVFPMFASALYYRHVRNQIAEARAASKESATQLARLSARGGTSNVGMFLTIAAVLVFLIGIVMGIVGGNYLGLGEKAKQKATKIEQIGQTLDLFRLEVGRYPTTQEGLQALITAHTGVPNWNGPYWKKSTLPKDIWNNEYKYASPGQHGAYDLWSYGADGKEGGEGTNKDITSWE